MMGLVIALHVLACICLIVLVLVQRGKGGGLLESFSGLESMLGTKTSSFLTRTTTIFSVVFFFTCLSLALLSVKRSKSLMSNTMQGQPAAVSPEAAEPAQAAPDTQAVQEAPAQEEKTPVAGVPTEQPQAAPKAE